MIQKSFASCIGPCHIGSWAGPICRSPIASRPSLLAAELGHVYSSAQAEFYASWLYALMRDTRRAELFASRAIASCEQGGFDFYGGLAQVIHGWAISFGPDPAAAIAEVSLGIEQVRAPEADICLSCFLPWLAEVHLLVGNVDEGLATMREAHELAEETFYDRGAMAR